MRRNLLAFGMALSLMAGPAHAYIGPGAGLGAIGTVIAVIGAILLMIVGFLWYPIKRMLKRGKNSVEQNEGQDEAS